MKVIEDGEIDIQRAELIPDVLAMNLLIGGNHNLQQHEETIIGVYCLLVVIKYWTVYLKCMLIVI